MIAVSSTRWSPALATILLVMSTTLQPFLLPTVQASVVSGIVRQMWRPSMDSNSGLTNRALAAGLLGKASSGLSPDARACRDSVEGNHKAMDALRNCTAYQLPWLDLVNATTNNSTERDCIKFYCDTYCGNLITSAFCLPNQHAAYRKEISQQGLDNNAKLCKPWDRFIPSLDSPPPITNETIQCDDTVVANAGKCVQEAIENLVKMNITDQIEFACKMLFEGEKCETEGACQNCAGGSVDEYLNFIGKVWSPAKVHCTKWANEEPKMECPVTPSSPASVSVTTSSSNTPMIVGIIIGVLVLLVAIGVAVYCLCFSTDKSAGPSSNAGSGGGSGGSSKINSGKAGSTMDSKQQSRIEAKQSSRA